jgi:plastocyanin
MRRVALILVFAIAGLASLGVSAIAADPTVTATSTPTDLFRPSKVAIRPGQTVHWHNSDGMHNVCFNATGQCIGGLAGTPADTRWNAQRTFNKAGTYRYYCSEHSDGEFGMVGKVVVDGTPPVISQLSKSGKNWSFKLSEAAKVVADVKKDKPGAPRTQIFSRKFAKGQNSFTYAGTGLKPGTYILRLRATDAVGNHSQPATKRFTKS